jgi:hypothetical protein
MEDSGHGLCVANRRILYTAILTISLAIFYLDFYPDDGLPGVKDGHVSRALIVLDQ